MTLPEQLDNLLKQYGIEQTLRAWIAFLKSQDPLALAQYNIYLQLIEDLQTTLQHYQQQLYDQPRDH